MSFAFFGPLLTKELRTRMRGSTVFLIENLYLLVLGGASAIILLSNLDPDSLAWEAGKRIFDTVSGIQVSILWILAAVVAASSVTQEREQKTYDLLMSTPITPAQFVFNKLAASISYFFILALLGLPLISMGFILGGVSFTQIVQAEVITIIALVLAGAFGVCLSALFGRSVAAVPVAGACVVFCIILSEALAETARTAFSFNPMIALTVVTENTRVRFFSLSVPVWIPFAILTLALSAALLSRAALSVTPYFKRDPLRYELLTLIACFLFLGAAAGSCIHPAESVEDNPEVLADGARLVFRFLLAIAFFVSLARPEFAALKVWSRKSPPPWLRLRGWIGGQVVSAPRFLLVLGMLSGAAVLYGWKDMEGVPGIYPGALAAMAVFALAPMALCLLSRIPMLWPERKRPRWGARRVCAAVVFFGATSMLKLVHYLGAQGAGIGTANPADPLMLLSSSRAIEAAADSVSFLDRFPGLADLDARFMLPGLHILYLLLALAVLGLINTILIRKAAQAPGTPSNEA